MSEEIETGTWYWDRRTRKALRPRQIDDGTVEFTSVWHAEEVDDALDGGALVPLDEIHLDRTETTFDLIDSFRLSDSGDGESNERQTDDIETERDA